MTTITNTMTMTQITIALNKLSDERELWENGSYKQSNDVLYGLLDNCLVVLEQMRSRRKLIESLNALLTERNVTFNNGTSLTTKVVRFVFGDCGKRAFTYSNVLNIAVNEKRESESMQSFISKRGGIEAVRRASKPGQVSKADNAKLQAQAAETYFATSTPLIANFASTERALKPSNDVSHTYVSALIRQNADGTHSVVFASDNERIVKLLLAEGGKQNALTSKKQMFASQSDARRDKRDHLLAQMSA